MGRRDDFCDLCSTDCGGRCYGAGDDMPEPNKRFNVAALVPIAVVVLAIVLAVVFRAQIFG